jgi:hypothetical protein
MSRMSKASEIEEWQKTARRYRQLALLAGSMRRSRSSGQIFSTGSGVLAQALCCLGGFADEFTLTTSASAT